MDARQAVDAPRVHLEGGVLYAEPGVEEPGIDLQQLAGAEAGVVRFGARNLFFGGVQAVQRRGDRLTGAGDPRRGGVAVSA
jgi:gamma-glutamyltranspeptidase/glutathione hydrolase